MLIWKDRNGDAFTSSLKLVVITLICERFGVKYEEIAVLNNLSD
jgi:hypothetical protein